MSDICEIVRKAENNYTTNTVRQSKYVNFSMYETIETINAYLNSKHTSGLTDALGREKPFFNIVTAATNIWYRATDIDRKNIKVLPNKSNEVAIAFIAQILLQQWMDKNRFGVFLNLWGRALARYGSAVVKFVEQNGELIPSVIPWDRFIADPIDFNAIPHIEKFYLTPEQLRRHPLYDQKVVDAIIDSEVTRKDFQGQNRDNFDNFIEIYEVHGELEEYLLSDNPEEEKNDDKKYVQQMHVVCFVETGVVNGKKEYADFTLYKGREKKDPYMITHLIPEDGRTLSIGAVEYLFDAQWMQNHSIKQWKDQVDLASKLIFQTADTNFVGRNVLTAIENGDIMVHAPNSPLNVVNNQGHDITSVQSFMSMWKLAGQEVTNTPDVTRGITQAQPMTYGLGQIMNENSNSLFELMTENKGLHTEDMLREHVLPHIKTKMDSSEEILAILDEQGIAEIDAMYVPNEAIRRTNKKKLDILDNYNFDGTLADKLAQVPSLSEAQSQVKQDLSTMGNKRSFIPSKDKNVKWKDILKNFEWDIRVEVTNENRDKQAVMQTLTTLFQTLAQTDPQSANIVKNKILTETGVVSPLELSTSSPPNVGGQQVGSGLQALTTK